MQEAFSLTLREESKKELVPLATLAYAINAEAAEVNRRAEIIGNYLVQAKEQLPNENSFMTWVSENCPFSHSTALGLMNYAKGVRETPCLIGKPKSIVLEVLKLPAGEREAFVEENGDKSVRQIRRLIQERDEARKEAEDARTRESCAVKARERIEDGITKANEMLTALKRERDYYANRAAALEEAPPEQIEVPVEVIPDDYEEAKRQAADAAEQLEAQIMENERLSRRVEDAEAYAEEQEDLRKQAQSELRRIRDSAEEAPGEASPFSALAVGRAVQSFMAEVGTLPHMSAFFRGMDTSEAQIIEKWLDVVENWVSQSKEAVRASSSVIDLDAVVR